MIEKRKKVGDLLPNTNSNNEKESSRFQYTMLTKIVIFVISISILVFLLFNQFREDTGQRINHEFLNGFILLNSNSNTRNIQCQNFDKPFQQPPKVFLTIQMNEDENKRLNKEGEVSLKVPQVVIINKPDLDSFCFRVIDDNESPKDIIIHWFATASY